MNRVRTLLGLVLLLVVAAVCLSVANAHQLALASFWVGHTQDVERQVEGLAGALVELESGARGYALGGAGGFLAEAREGEQASRGDLDALRRLTSDNPRQQQRLSRLDAAVDAKISYNHELMDARQRGLPEAAQVAASGRGVQLMAEIRAVLDEMRSEERGLLAARKVELDRLRRRTIVLGGIVVGLIVAAIAAFAVLALAESRARRRAAERIASSEERMRLLLDAVRDYAIIELDTEGRVTRWGDSAEKIFGWPRAEVEGRDLSCFYPPGDDWRRELRDAGAHERFEEEGLRVRRDGTQFWADVVVTAIRGPDGAVRGFAKVVRDVTERRALDDALRETARKLELSNRELQDFAMVASHDLQEPLRKVQMFGDKLRRKYSAQLGEEGQDWLRRMMNAAARGQSLIQGLLAFSRVTTKAQPAVPVDLNETAREVVSDLEARLADVNGRVEVGELPTVQADPLQMRQLLQNLIGNALKFRKPDVPPVVTVRGRADDGTAHLEVQDNGIGFDQKYTDRIFKLFQRLHERGAYEGSGMGLAICRKIVERHGGTIDARSAEGQGTTFQIELPTHH